MHTPESKREKREHTAEGDAERELFAPLSPAAGTFFLASTSCSRSVAKYEREKSLLEWDSCFYATCSAIEMRFEKGPAGEKCWRASVLCELSFSLCRQPATRSTREKCQKHTVHITQAAKNPSLKRILRRTQKEKKRGGCLLLWRCTSFSWAHNQHVWCWLGCKLGQNECALRINIIRTSVAANWRDTANFLSHSHVYKFLIIFPLIISHWKSILYDLLWGCKFFFVLR